MLTVHMGLFDRDRTSRVHPLYHITLWHRTGHGPFRNISRVRCALVHCQVALWHRTRHRPAAGRLQQHRIIGGASPPCACPCHVPYKYIEYICYVPHLPPHMRALPAVFCFATSTATTATTAKAIMALHCTLSGVAYRVCTYLCACPLSRHVVPPCHVQSGTFSTALMCAWRSPFISRRDIVPHPVDGSAS